MKRKDNPAKRFLMQYIALCGRVDALQKAINRAMEQATNISVTLKEVKVLSSPANHDRMAEDVVSAVDACEILYQYKAEAETALREILEAVDSLKDEQQKQLIIMRYINGDSFAEIQKAMNYAESQPYVIHGRALIGINKWLKGRMENGKSLHCMRGNHS